MTASCPPASASPVTEPRVPEHLRARAEAAFRAALTDSLDHLALCDRNLLRFHYVHGLGAAQLAKMFSRSRSAMIRQLARIRERMLRDTRRGLAGRLAIGRRELDHLSEVARHRFDHAIARILCT